VGVKEGIDKGSTVGLGVADDVDGIRLDVGFKVGVLVIDGDALGRKDETQSEGIKLEAGTSVGATLEMDGSADEVLGVNVGKLDEVEGIRVDGKALVLKLLGLIVGATVGAKLVLGINDGSVDGTKVNI